MKHPSGSAFHPADGLFHRVSLLDGARHSKSAKARSSQLTAPRGQLSTPRRRAAWLAPPPSGDPLEGVWHDRTQEYRYRLRGKEPEPGQFATVETLTLDPLPCWKHLPPEEYRRRIAELVAEIEEEARVAREAKGIEPLGVDAVRRQQPHTRPNRTKKSPAPLFHTASKKAYQSLREAYSRFVAAFRDAAEKLRAGDRMVAFPEGSFPPAAPFVRPAFA